MGGQRRLSVLHACSTLTDSFFMYSTALLSSLIAAIYDAALDLERWPVFLKEFAEVVDASAAALLYHDLHNPLGVITASFHVDPESQRLYAEHFGRIDPWVKGAESKGVLIPEIIHIGEELISRNDFL